MSTNLGAIHIALAVVGMSMAAVVSLAAIGNWSPNSVRLPLNSRDFDPWQDTFAQWLMALVSIVATGISVWAVRMVVATLQATRAGVTATREVGKDQSRAYLHVDKAEITWGNSNARNPAVTIHITNSGTTPARWFEVRSRTVVSFWDSGTAPPEYESFFVPLPQKPFRWNAIGAGATLTAPALRSEDRDEFVKARDNLAKIEAFGVLRYETFFGEIFESEFWFVARGPVNFRYKDGEPLVEIPTVMQRASRTLRTFAKIADTA